VILIRDGKLYDRLKFLAQILLPALGALYFSLAGIWGLPEADKVVGTIVCFDTFLGVLLGLSTAAYEKSGARYSGAIVVGDQLEDGMQNFRMELPLDAKNIVEQKELVLKVKKP
jgi:Putative phage holin Dp-1